MPEENASAQGASDSGSGPGSAAGAEGTGTAQQTQQQTPQYVSKADFDQAMARLNETVDAGTRRIQSQGDKAAHVVERAMQRKMEALQRGYEQELGKVATPEELQAARASVNAQVGAIEAESSKEQLDQITVDRFIEVTLRESGIPLDDPDLDRASWTGQRAFLTNVSLVKKRMAADAKIKELEGRLQLTAKQQADLDAAKKQAENLSAAAQGAGVGASVPGVSGPRDWLKADPKDVEKERERLRNQLYK